MIGPDASSAVHDLGGRVGGAVRRDLCVVAAELLGYVAMSKTRASLHAMFISKPSSGWALLLSLVCSLLYPAFVSSRDTEDEEQRPVWRYDSGGGDCSFSHGGQRVLAVGGNAAIVLDADTGKPLTPPMRHEEVIYRASFSPDGRTVVTASADHTARLWDAATGKELTPPLRHKEWVWSAAFSPDGAKVVTASGDRTAQVWDAATGKPLLSIPLRDAVLSATFSSDGKRILTVGRFPDANAYVWDAATGKLLVGPVGREVRCAAFSPDGKRIATGERHDTSDVVCIWDAGTGALVAQTAEGKSLRIMAVAFSPDGSKVGAACDGFVRVWDAATGRPLTKPLGDKVSRMYVVLFDRTGKHVLGAGEGGLAAIWDVPTGQEVVRLSGFDVYTDAAFSPDGRRLIVGCTNITHESQAAATCLWDLSTTPK